MKRCPEKSAQPDYLLVVQKHSTPFKEKISLCNTMVHVAVTDSSLEIKFKLKNKITSYNMWFTSENEKGKRHISNVSISGGSCF